jgi:hypothetical protein
VFVTMSSVCVFFDDVGSDRLKAFKSDSMAAKALRLGRDVEVEIDLLRSTNCVDGASSRIMFF